MATRSTNTLSEVLEGVMQDLSRALLLPDAQNPETVGFITDMMAQIADRVTAPYRTSQLPPSDSSGMPMGGMQSPMAGMEPGGGGPMPGPPQMPSPGPSGPTPPRPLAGVTSGTPMPNPDELRRILGTGAR